MNGVFSHLLVHISLWSGGLGPFLSLLLLPLLVLHFALV